MINRREFVKSTLAAAASTVITGRSRSSQEQPLIGPVRERPNVLLFMVDQMRRPRWFPSSAPLPSYERLKAAGMEFTHHFTSAVPCSPSRACLMTGLYSDKNNVQTNLGQDNIQAALDPAIPNLGRLFRDAGYQTAYCGKWHLSQDTDSEKEHGLDCYGFERIWATDREPKDPGLMLDGPYTSAAIKWLSNPDNRRGPWFMVVSLANPHDVNGYPDLALPDRVIPAVADRLPDNWDDDLKGKPHCQVEFQTAYNAAHGNIDPTDKEAWLHLINYYYYLTKKSDGYLGQVLDTLGKFKLTDNTIVIFTSDHGEMCGSHRLRAKGPFVYAESTNIPLLMSWPGHIHPGSHSDVLCQNVDLFPTLASLLGSDVASRFPHLPGKDLGPLLKEPEHPSLAEHVLFSYSDSVYLEMANQARGKPTLRSPHQIRAIREKDWVYARYFDPHKKDREFELYDIKNDPLEMHNLANDPGYSAFEKEMKNKLREAEKTEMRGEKN